MSEQRAPSGVEVVAPDDRVTRAELCTRCRIDVVLLDALVEHGVVEPDAGGGFAEVHRLRIVRAVRVMHELDVEVDHLALVLDLLERIRAQRRTIDRLGRVVVRRR